MLPCGNVKNVYHVALPIFYISKFFGYASFTIDGTYETGVIRIKWFELLFTLPSFICFVYFCTKRDIFNIFASHSSLLDYASQTIFIVGFSLWIFNMLSLLYLHKKIFNIVRQLHDIDLHLENIGAKINHKYQRKLIIIYFCTCFGFICVVTIASYVLIDQAKILQQSWDMHISSLYNSGLYSIVISQYLWALLGVRSRYHLLNTWFQKIFLKKPQIKLLKNHHTIQMELVTHFAVIHDKLNDLLELINYCYSVQIMLAVGLCFIFSVFCAFGVYRGIVVYNLQIFIIILIDNLWNIYYSSFVIIVVIVGSLTTRTGKHTAVLIHKAINLMNDQCIVYKLSLFSQQMMHRMPIVTCGLFSYDWTLFYSAIGASATYLIILIQFDTSIPGLNAQSRT